MEWTCWRVSPPQCVQLDSCWGKSESGGGMIRSLYFKSRVLGLRVLPESWLGLRPSKYLMWSWNNRTNCSFKSSWKKVLLSCKLTSLSPAACWPCAFLERIAGNSSVFLERMWEMRSCRMIFKSWSWRACLTASSDWRPLQPDVVSCALSDALAKPNQGH